MPKVWAGRCGLNLKPGRDWKAEWKHWAGLSGGGAGSLELLGSLGVWPCAERRGEGRLKSRSVSGRWGPWPRAELKPGRPWEAGSEVRVGLRLWACRDRVMGGALSKGRGLVWLVILHRACLQVLGLCGAAYRPTEEIDLRSVGWGNIFQLPFKHVRDFRLRHLVPFFIYSGFEVLFACTGLALVSIGCLGLPIKGCLV